MICYIILICSPPNFQYKLIRSIQYKLIRSRMRTDQLFQQPMPGLVYSWSKVKQWALQLVGQAAEFKFESKYKPLQVIWRYLQRLFQKVIKGLEGKINDQARGAALWLCLRG